MHRCFPSEGVLGKDCREVGAASHRVPNAFGDLLRDPWERSQCQTPWAVFSRDPTPPAIYRLAQIRVLGYLSSPSSRSWSSSIRLRDRWLDFVLVEACPPVGGGFQTSAVHRAAVTARACQKSQTRVTRKLSSLPVDAPSLFCLPCLFYPLCILPIRPGIAAPIVLAGPAHRCSH